MGGLLGTWQDCCWDRGGGVAESERGSNSLSEERAGCSGCMNPSTQCCKVLVCGVCLTPPGRFLLSSKGLESAGGLKAAAEARSCSASYRCQSRC